MSIAHVITGEARHFATTAPLFWANTVGSRVPRHWRNGRVQAVFERACHIVTDNGGFLALLSADCGNVAHGIRLKTRPRLSAHLRAGEQVTFAENRLTVGQRQLTIDLSEAEPWQCELRPGLFDDTAGLSQHAARAERHLIQEAARRDSDCLKVVTHVAELSTPLADLVRRQLSPLKAAQHARDHAAALQTIRHLIGLGPGLTPAGDDFIIGWLAGLTLAASTPDKKHFLDDVCEGVREFRQMTTMVSAQHLDDACHLNFSERLSDLCVAIGRGLPDADLRDRMDAQLAVGASSGADAAAGLIFALTDLE